MITSEAWYHGSARSVEIGECRLWIDLGQGTLGVGPVYPYRRRRYIRPTSGTLLALMRGYVATGEGLQGLIDCVLEEVTDEEFLAEFYKFYAAWNEHQILK